MRDADIFEIFSSTQNSAEAESCLALGDLNSTIQTPGVNVLR